MMSYIEPSKPIPIWKAIKRVFIGYDPRQPIAYNVLQHSIVTRASEPIAVTPLILKQLPICRRGLTEFTYSRFLIPWLCDFKGSALFLDADMVVTGDIVELFNAANYVSDVQVMKDQPKFEWASAMLFNNARCNVLQPEFIDDTRNPLLDLAWAKSIGEFPAEWNHCVGYQKPTPSKLYHYTQGIPCWAETAGVEDEPWTDAAMEMVHTVSWSELMGESVHAEKVRRANLG